MALPLVRIGILASSRPPPVEDQGPDLGPPRDMFYVAENDLVNGGGNVYKFTGPDAANITSESVFTVIDLPGVAIESIVAHDNGVWAGYSTASSTTGFTHINLDGSTDSAIDAGSGEISFSIAKNGNLAIQSGSTLTIWNPDGTELLSQNLVTKLGSATSFTLATSGSSTLNEPEIFNTFLVFGVASSETISVSEINSNGAVLRTVELPDITFGTNRLYRHNVDVAIGLSTVVETGEKSITFVDLRNQEIFTRAGLEDQSSPTPSLDPNLDEVNIGYISYDITDESGRNTKLGTLARNTSVNSIILDGGDNSTVKDWTVYDADTIYWVNDSGDAQRYTISEETSEEILVSAGISGFSTTSAQGLGNVAVVASDLDETNETQIYDSVGNTALTEIQNIGFGDSSTIRSTIVPGTIDFQSDESLNIINFGGETGFTDGVFLAN